MGQKHVQEPCPLTLVYPTSSLAWNQVLIKRLTTYISFNRRSEQTGSQTLPSGLPYEYRTVSVDHLDELQEDIDRLRNDGKLSQQAIYQSYMKELNFKLPNDFQDAKSMIIMAIPTKLLLPRFHLDGKPHKVVFPSNYSPTGLAEEDVKKTLAQQITGRPDSRIERTASVHMKLLAVRSGLGLYGRNNLCYVKGMGSMLRLWSFLTDQKLKDNWHEIKLMEPCKNCKACATNCPNGCITDNNFVIDAGKCVTLYNEVLGKFPEWINRNVHNSLFGCIKCQAACPINRNVLSKPERLEDVTEEETIKILKGEPDQELLDSLSRKLRGIVPTKVAEYFPTLTRNLTVLLDVEKQSP